MKSLLLIRHAKSSWENIDQKDFDRPLTKRGIQDATNVALHLFNQQINISLFLTSPAVRALTTCELFAQVYGKGENSIAQVPDLYNPFTDNFYKIISRVDSKDAHIALFSHNPSITEFANSLTSTKIDHLPTCGVFAIQADIEHWHQLKDSSRQFWFFFSPKMLE